jgi:hypothetical protein
VSSSPEPKLAERRDSTIFAFAPPAGVQVIVRFWSAAVGIPTAPSVNASADRAVTVSCGKPSSTPGTMNRRLSPGSYAMPAGSAVV